MKTTGNVLLRCLATVGFVLLVTPIGLIAGMGWALTAVTLPALEWLVPRLGALWAKPD